MTTIQDFPVVKKTINGAIASVMGISILYPLDLMKTQLQIQNLNSGECRAPKMNILSLFRRTFKAEGILGLYKGSSVSYSLVVPEKALYMASNDFFRHHLSRGYSEPLSTGKSVLSGGLAAITTLTMTTPLELVKIQMQRSQLKTKSSPVSVFYNIFKTRGVTGLYQGLVATSCRELIFACTLFPVIAYIQSLAPTSPQLKNPWSFFAGLIAGSTAAVVSTPFDVVKTRLQAATSSEGSRFSGVWHTGRQIYSQEGLRGLMKGGLCRVMILAPMFGILEMVYLLNIAERVFGTQYRASEQANGKRAIRVD